MGRCWRRRAVLGTLGTMVGTGLAGCLGAPEPTAYVSDSAGAVHAVDTDGTVRWHRAYDQTLSVLGVTAAGVLVRFESPGSKRVGILR